MSWKTITADDVLSEFTPAEQATLEAIQGAAEQLPGVVARGINAARGAIRAGGYALGEDGTVPDALEPDVIAIARWRWLIAFPQLQRLQTPEREAAHDRGQARLDAVARQQWSVEAPRPGANPPSGNWNSERRVPGRMEREPRAHDERLGRPAGAPGAGAGGTEAS